MKKFILAVLTSTVLTSQVPLTLASGTSAPPPTPGHVGIEAPQAFQYESAKGRVVFVDKERGILVLREERKKSPKEIRLTVNGKTTIRVGKERIDLGQLLEGQLVKAVFDRAFNAISIRLEKEKRAQA